MSLPSARSVQALRAASERQNMMKGGELETARTFRSPPDSTINKSLTDLQNLNKQTNHNNTQQQASMRTTGGRKSRKRFRNKRRSRKSWRKRLRF